MGRDPAQGLIDVLWGAVCVHRDGRVVHANRAFLDELGLSDVADAARVEVGALVHPDSRPLFEERWRALSEDAPSAPAADLHWCRRDGTTFTMKTAAVRMPYEGEPSVVEIAVPAAGQAQEVLRVRLASSDRLAAVGTLAAGVAHEINNPLSYVLANLDYIREQLHTVQGKLPPAMVEDLDAVAAEAKQGAERVAQIVRSLKVFSRGDEEKRAPLDLIEVLETSLELASNEIRHRARLVKTYRPVPAVLADSGRLTQAFLNVLVNAAQAIPEGRADANDISVKTWTDMDGRAVVEVQDTGSGIAADHLPRIFDPFFTTKAQGVGTGLGLSVCDGTVRALGGEVIVESTLGKGTLLRVVLPGVAPAAGRPETPRVTTGRGRRGKILVVDDDPAIGTAIRRTLSQGHDVTATTSGREAIDRVRGGERFDLILCDLMMPVVTGMDLHAELTRHVPEQASRMVFLTGGAFTQSARAFLDRVSNERFDKPFDAARLRILARTLIDATSAPAPVPERHESGSDGDAREPEAG